MKLLKYTLLFILTLNVAFAQNNIKRADQFYEKFDFTNALDLYTIAEKNNPDNIQVKERIGNCYKFLNQIQNAESWYEAVVKSNQSDPIYNFYYAQSLMSNGKYNKALDELNKYYEKTDPNKELLTEFPSNILRENYNYKIEIENFNSNDDDFSPYKIEDEVFFVSNRNVDAGVLKEDVWSGKFFTQLYHVNTLDSTNTKAEVFNNSSISKRFHEGPIAFNPNKSEFYFTRSNYSNLKPNKSSDDAVNLKILKAPFSVEDIKGGNFNTKLEIEDNFTFSSDDYSIAYPAISEDGKYLIFASDMPNGFGGLDLYVSERVGNEWSNPINLGEEINTVGNEAYPFLTKDGVLYFSSDGLLGLGSYDIFESKLKSNGAFETPVNLRSPVNSSYNDFGIWVNEDNSLGYFSSNRPAEFGQSNIYSFVHNYYNFEALVYDSRTKKPLEDVEIVITEVLYENEFTLLTDDSGIAKHEISPNTKYKILITKENYTPEEAEFTTIENDVQAEIPLKNNAEILLDLNILEARTLKEIPNADLVVYNLQTEEKQSLQTNMFGKATIVLEPDNDYRIIAQKEIPNSDSVYISVSRDISTKNLANNNLSKTIHLSKECSGCEIIIDDILYDLDKSYIRADAALILNKLVKVLKDNPKMVIELASHTDCRASAAYNNSLSTRRAEAAVEYLIQNGISASRLTARGYGESRPIEVPGQKGLYCSCENDKGPGLQDARCTEEMHQLNRRTSFTILKR